MIGSAMSNYEQTFDLRGHLYNQATAMCPEARASERATVIEWLAPRAGETVCDAPAGGGYVADGLRARFGDSLHVLCVEPSKNFANAIAESFEVFNEPLHATSIATGSVDRVVSLAGLHHVADKHAVLHEWARLLRPGGRCAVADVLSGSQVGVFLNGFVNEFTPGGHVGMFPEEGEFSNWFAGSGFVNLREESVSVPWEFSDEETLGLFCHRLFGLTKTEPERVLEALRTTVGIETSADRVWLMWSLRYASGERT